MLKKINKILAIAFTTLLFFACSNISEEVAEQTNESGAFLKIAIEESSARTVFPNTGVALDDFETIKLESSADSARTTLAEWTSTAEKSAYAQMSEAKVAVSKGDFLFILTATKGGKTMCGETSLTIDKTENKVSFTLLPYSGDGSGNIDVKIRYTNTDIGCVKAGLFDFENIENPVAGYEAKRLTPTEESGTYTIEYKKEGVAAGKYMLTFFFYADADASLLLNTYNETVVVVGGFASEKTHDFGDMNAAYKITYNNTDDANENANPESYTIYSLPLTLKSPKKTGYSFLGWYEDSAFSGNRIYQILPEGIGDKTLHAKWAEAKEFTKDTLNGINSDCNNKVIKVTGEIDDATISTLNTKIKSLEGITLDLSETTGITSIGRSAFIYNTKLINIMLPDCITSIGYQAFSGCSGLTSVTIPESVTSIGEDAFYGCTGLTRVDASSIEDWLGISFGDFSANPLYYAKHLYVGGTEVTSLNVIPSSVTSIGDYAFSGCEGLTSVEIPSSVTSIGSYAFYGCEGLTSVEIPSSVTSIGEGAFYGCEGLTRVDVSSIADWLGISFGNSYANPLYYAKRLYVGGTEVTSLNVIPSSVTSIGTGAFAGWSVESIVIPDHITSIGDVAFYNCKDLTNVEIPSGVTSIGNSAFSGCEGLTNVEIPSSVTSIGAGAFLGCGLTSITIPSSVTSIGDHAFSSCKKVTIQGDITSIGSYAFSSCEEVTIQGNITSVGSEAFKRCEKVTFNGNATTIPAKMFMPKTYSEKNTTLKTVVIGSSVTSIGDYAFERCTGLESVTIGDSVTSIGVGAFDDCTGLTSVTIPNSVTSIGSYAFYNCTGLESVTIPESVTSIGFSAFYGCTGLTSVTFKDPNGWWYATSADATTGTSIDVSTPTTNATNLRLYSGDWRDKYLFKGSRN